MTIDEQSLAISGQIIAADVSEDEYMTHYAADFCEWVAGKVVKMSPIMEEHDKLDRFLAITFEMYFEFRPIGTLRQAPFVMVIGEGDSRRRREPDLQIILNENPHELSRSAMNGPADIAIEVVSEESTQRDYGEKFYEYEKAGVREYWLIDPIRKQTRFHRLTDEGTYSLILPDGGGNFTSPLLPGLRLHIPTLWQAVLPAPGQIWQQMKAELGT